MSAVTPDTLRPALFAQSGTQHRPELRGNVLRTARKRAASRAETCCEPRGNVLRTARKRARSRADLLPLQCGVQVPLTLRAFIA